MTVLFLNHHIFFFYHFNYFCPIPNFQCRAAYICGIYYWKAGVATQPLRHGWLDNELDFSPGDSTVWGGFFFFFLPLCLVSLNVSQNCSERNGFGSDLKRLNAFWKEKKATTKTGLFLWYMVRVIWQKSIFMLRKIG